MDTIKLGEDVMSDVYIDLNSIKEFTQEHLETYQRLNPEEAYPWLFGDELPESLEVMETTLVDISGVNWLDNEQGIRTQGVRSGGKNPKYKEISRDISNFGFKLTQPAISLLQLNNEIIPLNGRTRSSIFENSYSHLKNIIAIVYQIKKEYLHPDGTPTPQAESDISIFGCSANAYTDPSGDLSKEDVVREVKGAIEKGWITQNLKDIQDRVGRLCGKGVFTERTRSDLSFRIFNQFSQDDKILPWDVSNVKLWRNKNKLVDVDWDAPKSIDGGETLYRGIKYVVVSSETLEKSVGTVARTAKENPDYFIRVVIHTGILKGFDPETNYLEKVDKFRTVWNNHLDNLAYAFFNGGPALQKRVRLFGALPAIQSMHDLTKLVKFVTKDLENLEGLEQSA